MPIYAYRCSACGHAKDVLQKMSDPLLVTCPACGEPTFTKQVTAAGFQLKGSGWYVTDFRGGDTGKKPDAEKGDKAEKAGKDGDSGAKASADAAAPKSESSKAEAAAPAPAASPSSTPTSAPAPAAAKPSASPPSSST